MNSTNFINACFLIHYEEINEVLTLKGIKKRFRWILQWDDNDNNNEIIELLHTVGSGKKRIHHFQSNEWLEIIKKKDYLSTKFRFKWAINKQMTPNVTFGHEIDLNRIASGPMVLTNTYLIISKYRYLSESSYELYINNIPIGKTPQSPVHRTSRTIPILPSSGNIRQTRASLPSAISSPPLHGLPPQGSMAYGEGSRSGTEGTWSALDSTRTSGHEPTDTGLSSPSNTDNTSRLSDAQCQERSNTPIKSTLDCAPTFTKPRLLYSDTALPTPDDNTHNVVTFVPSRDGDDSCTYSRTHSVHTWDDSSPEVGPGICEPDPHAERIISVPTTTVLTADRLDNTTVRKEIFTSPTTPSPSIAVPIPSNIQKNATISAIEPSDIVSYRRDIPDRSVSSVCQRIFTWLQDVMPSDVSDLDLIRCSLLLENLNIVTVAILYRCDVRLFDYQELVTKDYLKQASSGYERVVYPNAMTSSCALNDECHYNGVNSENLDDESFHRLEYESLPPLGVILALQNVIRNKDVENLTNFSTTSTCSFSAAFPHRVPDYMDSTLPEDKNESTTIHTSTVGAAAASVSSSDASSSRVMGDRSAGTCNLDTQTVFSASLQDNVQYSVITDDEVEVDEASLVDSTVTPPVPHAFVSVTDISSQDAVRSNLSLPVCQDIGGSFSISLWLPEETQFGDISPHIAAPYHRLARLLTSSGYMLLPQIASTISSRYPMVKVSPCPTLLQQLNDITPSMSVFTTNFHEKGDASRGPRSREMSSSTPSSNSNSSKVTLALNFFDFESFSHEYLCTAVSFAKELVKDQLYSMEIIYMPLSLKQENFLISCSESSKPAVQRLFSNLQVLSCPLSRIRSNPSQLEHEGVCSCVVSTNKRSPCHQGCHPSDRQCHVERRCESMKVDSRHSMSSTTCSSSLSSTLGGVGMTKATTSDLMKSVLISSYEIDNVHMSVYNCPWQYVVNNLGAEAIICPANMHLQYENARGLAGQIFQSIGPVWSEELTATLTCLEDQILKVGNSIVTTAGTLSTTTGLSSVIHTLVPTYASSNEVHSQLFVQAITSALTIAQARRVSVLAIPAIGAGSLGWPSNLATTHIAKTVVDWIKHINSNPNSTMRQFCTLNIRRIILFDISFDASHDFARALSSVMMPCDKHKLVPSTLLNPSVEPICSSMQSVYDSEEQCKNGLLLYGSAACVVTARDAVLSFLSTLSTLSFSTSLRPLQDLSDDFSTVKDIAASYISKLYPVELIEKSDGSYWEVEVEVQVESTTNKTSLLTREAVEDCILHELSSIMKKEYYSVKYPKFWVNPIQQIDACDVDDNSFSKLFVVPYSSKEFQVMSKWFLSNNFSCRILCIQRVQNYRLWYRYMKKKEQILKENNQVSGEKILKHGTSNTSPLAICNTILGFNISCASSGIWGTGVYFADDPAYSHMYRHVLTTEEVSKLTHQDAHFQQYIKNTKPFLLPIHEPHDTHVSSGGGSASSGVFQVLLSLVALGRVLHRQAWTDADRRIVGPPPGYHSICGRVADDLESFVIYDNHQAYPAYVVTYSL